MQLRINTPEHSQVLAFDPALHPRDPAPGDRGPAPGQHPQGTRAQGGAQGDRNRTRGGVVGAVA